MTACIAHRPSIPGLLLSLWGPELLSGVIAFQPEGFFPNFSKTGLLAVTSLSVYLGMSLFCLIFEGRFSGISAPWLMLLPLLSDDLFLVRNQTFVVLPVRTHNTFFSSRCFRQFDFDVCGCLSAMGIFRFPGLVNSCFSSMRGIGAIASSLFFLPLSLLCSWDSRFIYIGMWDLVLRESLRPHLLFFNLFSCVLQVE